MSPTFLISEGRVRGSAGFCGREEGGRRTNHMGVLISGSIGAI